MSNKRHYFLMASLIALAMLLSACSFKPVNVPPVNKYTITTVSGKQSQRISSRNTIFVSTSTAAPAFESDAMQYTRSRYQIQSFNYNSWVAPPADMLLPLITQSLRNTNYFKAVVSPPYSGISNYRLDTKILAFYQSFSGSNSRFHFTLQATLINNNTQQAIATRTFSSVITAAGANPRAGVVAANLAVKQVLWKLTYFCAKAK